MTTTILDLQQITKYFSFRRVKELRRWFRFRKKRDASHSPQITPKTVCTKTRIEIFLLCESGQWREENRDFPAFFMQDIHCLAKRISAKPIFLSKYEALQHVRFSHKAQIILRAYLPESTIIGQSGQLMLNNNAFKMSDIHGCFPYHCQELQYYSNPYFETQLTIRPTLVEG